MKEHMLTVNVMTLTGTMVVTDNAFDWLAV